METIDVNGLGTSEPIQLDFKKDTGIELLMNQKKAFSSSSSKVNFNNMNELENELDEIVKETEANKMSQSSSSSMFGNWFSSPSSTQEDSKLGQATKDSIGNTQTWDGFTKLNDSYVASEKTNIKSMNEGEKRRKKRAMLKKLNQWQEKKGLPLFSTDMSYEDIEEEYESAHDEHQKAESIKLQAWWLKTLVSTVEYGSSFVDFDLSGFSEQVEDDIDSYDDIFEDLYERYKGGKLHPIVSLCLKLGITAATVNITNRALSTAAPGFRDVIKQSPELMKMFTTATADAMSQKSTGFGFANQMTQPPQPPQPQQFQPMDFKPSGGRPDIKEARGFTINEDSSSSTEKPEMRPPMTGPSIELEQLFSGLKPSASAPTKSPSYKADDSIVSISSIKDLQNTQLPKTSGSAKRRNRSEKNTVALDI